ncbi:ABC transporter substrate-binding protein [Microbacterium sp. ZXX196]|uniref:ABC transporter substrate-binding protein n=1 Tax=Microbacterium sp. ZXX196 TaxID=2609291 RepID=UPI0012B9B733|nr:ABC transporter substrate-binding protein [Microbacterium sp. ZXX196]MTE23793.1 peptide ABC transporter substrate-binding protein [Microbacterium sp. ZXX196]
MTLPSRARTRALAVAVSAALAVTLASCAGEPSGSAGTGNDIIVGTTDTVTHLDPAGSYDNGSLTLQTQVFPYLVNTAPNSTDVVPDLAETAEFTGPSEYTVTLPEGLTWANGNDLTSSDVKFTFDRQLAIADPNGPSSLLFNLESVEAPDEQTVVFHLISENDQTFPFVLTSFPGAIVDEESFSAEAVTSDDDIVAANAFGGPYSISDYTFNELVELVPNENYSGLVAPAANDSVLLNYYAESSNLKLAVEDGTVDVAYRSLSPSDVEDLSGNDALTVHDGPGGEIRYIVFNFDTQPYGAATDEADADAALAVRQAVASLLDREALSSQVYDGTYTPLYSYVPEGFAGATEPLKEMYGDGAGGPSAEAAAQALDAAGVETPVELSLQYSPDHYGPNSADEYALIEQQLEADGMFDVTLAGTEWVQYSDDRVADVYPAYQLGWFPDYSDADNYLTPFFLTENFLVNHYEDAEVNDLILQQASTPDAAEREALIGEIQQRVAEDLSTVPYLQGAQVAVAASDVSGVVLDASFKLRMASLTR